MDTIIRIITPKEKEMREKFPELYKQVDRLNKLIENTETEKLNQLTKINLRFSRYLYKHKVQFTRDYTGQRSDGRGAARQIFHVIFKLSLVAAMVVIIKSTTRRLSSKDTFSQVSR